MSDLEKRVAELEKNIERIMAAQTQMAEHLNKLVKLILDRAKKS
jgi:predicted transcriptional regulator